MQERAGDEQFVIYWTGRIRRAMRREFEARATDLQITVPQYRVLRRLWEGDGILTSLLTQDACTDSGTITGLLDRMEAKGLLRRERGTEDRRAVCVYLTDKGRSLQEPLMAVRDALNLKALEGFRPEEREHLLQALKQVCENLGG